MKARELPEFRHRVSCPKCGGKRLSHTWHRGGEWPVRESCVVPEVEDEHHDVECLTCSFKWGEQCLKWKGE